MLAHKRLNKTLRYWRRWPIDARPKLIDEFTIGKTHDTFGLMSGDRRLVLKLFRQPQPVAIKVQQWAAKNSLAPMVLYSDRYFSYALMDHLSARHKPDLYKLAKGLTTLHQSRFGHVASTAGDFDLLSYCNQYIENAGVDANALHQELLPVLKLFLTDSTPKCLCHNDLVKENCFSYQQQAVFIDWEFAQINNPWFDLASIIYYHKYDEQQSRDFLKRYADDWGAKADEPIFYAAQCAVLWIDILWHIAYSDADDWETQQAKVEDLKKLVSKVKT